MAQETQTQPKIPIIDPHGQLGTIDASQYKDAITNLGFRAPTPQDIQAFQEKEQYGRGALNPIVAGAEAAGSAATLGLSRQLENATGLTTPEAQAARAKLNPNASTIGTGLGIGAPIAASLLAGPEVGAAALAGEGAEGAGAATAGTAAEAAGAVGAEGAGGAALDATKGALSSDLLPINAVGKMGRAITDAVTPAGIDSMGLPAQILAKGGAHALGSAVEGAAFGLGQSVDEDALGDPDALGEKLLPNMGLGALIGAGIGGSVGAAGPMIKGVGKILPDARGLGKKLLSTFGGMSEQDIDAYMSKREAVNSAPEFHDVYTQALGHVQEIQDQLEAKTITAQEAKSALDAKAAEIKQSFQDLGYDTRKAKTLAQDALDQAQDKLASDLQSNALGQAPQVAEAVNALHDNVVAGSANAFDVLSQQEGTVSLRGFFQKASELQSDLEAEATPEAKAMSERIAQYIENVKAEHGSDVRPAAAKILIQGLDKVSKYDFNASSFDKGISRYYKQLRYYLDDKIKDAFPEYRAAMKPLSNDTKLLSQLSKYGTPEGATSKISSLKREVNYRNEMPLLRQLEERTGAKFTHAIEPYANPETAKALHEALPEFANAKKAIEAHEALQNPRMKRALQEIEASPEYKAHQAAQAALDAAKAKKAELGVTQTNLQGKLTQAMRGKNIEAMRLIGALPEMEGQSVPDVLDNIRLKEAFQKGSTNGSRNVNMYGGAMGAAAGLLTGHFYLGAGLGGAVGGFMDKYGPQVTKKILDTYADNAIHVGTLSALERAGQKATLAITQSSKAIFSGAGSMEKAASVSHSDHEKLADNLSAFANDPNGMIDKLDQATRPIYYSAPKTAGALQQTAIRGAQFLQSKLPQLPAAKPFAPKMKPSRAEISQFNRYYAVVENPSLALDQVRNGMLTPETMETLQTVYPKLLGEMQAQVMDAMTSHLAKNQDATLPAGKRLALSMFLGQDLDEALSQQALASTQMALTQMGGAQSGPQQGPQGVRPTQKGLGAISQSSRLLTSNQSNSQRNES